MDRPLVSIVNLCIQGVGDKRYPNIPRVLSVRTERSSRRSPPRRGTTVRLFGAYGKSVPPHMQRLLASKKTCCGRAGPGGTPVRAASLQFELIMGGQGNSGKNFVSD